MKKCHRDEFYALNDNDDESFGQPLEDVQKTDEANDDEDEDEDDGTSEELKLPVEARPPIEVTGHETSAVDENNKNTQINVRGNHSHSTVHDTTTSIMKPWKTRIE